MYALFQNPTQIQSASKPWTPSASRAKKRKAEGQNQRLEAYTNALKAITEKEEPRDMHTAFGEYVAARTRPMDLDKAKAIHFKIMNILNEG